jgi:hypothetical protein
MTGNKSSHNHIFNPQILLATKNRWMYYLGNSLLPVSYETYLTGMQCTCTR